MNLGILGAFAYKGGLAHKGIFAYKYGFGLNVDLRFQEDLIKHELCLAPGRSIKISFTANVNFSFGKITGTIRNT